MEDGAGAVAMGGQLVDRLERLMGLSERSVNPAVHLAFDLAVVVEGRQGRDRRLEDRAALDLTANVTVDLRRAERVLGSGDPIAGCRDSSAKVTVEVVEGVQVVVSMEERDVDRVVVGCYLISLNAQRTWAHRLPWARAGPIVSRFQN